MTTVKDELHRLVDTLGEEHARDALEYVQWLMADSEELTDEELQRVREGEGEIERGEYVSLTELRRKLGV